MNVKYYIFKNKIRQVYFGDGTNLNLKEYFNCYYSYNNNYESALFLSYHNDDDLKLINSHKGNKYLLATTNSDIVLIEKLKIKDIKILSTIKSNFFYVKLIKNSYDKEYYKEFFNLLENKSIMILCKGKLQSKPMKKYDVCIGVKQSIAILQKKDILIMNDFEGIFGLENCIKEVKYILFPNAIHYQHKPSLKHNKILRQYLKICGFKGKIINYELDTNENPNPKLIHLSNIDDSGNIIFHFLNICSNVKNVDIYGYYSNLEDNSEITEFVMKAKPLDNFKKDYISYINRVYNNKSRRNELNFRISSKETLVKKKERMTTFCNKQLKFS